MPRCMNGAVAAAGLEGRQARKGGGPAGEAPICLTPGYVNNSTARLQHSTYDPHFSPSYFESGLKTVKPYRHRRGELSHFHAWLPARIITKPEG